MNLQALRARAFRARSNERGFVILPMLGMVAVIAMVAVAGYGIFRYINNSFTVRIEQTNLTAIVTGAKSLKSSGSYANVDNSALQRIQAFGSMTGSAVGGTVRNRWNGTVEVTGTASQLTVVYNNVPSSVCDQFVIGAMESGEFADPAPTCNEDEATDLTFVAY